MFSKESRAVRFGILRSGSEAASLIQKELHLQTGLMQCDKVLKHCTQVQMYDPLHLKDTYSTPLQ